MYYYYIFLKIDTANTLHQLPNVQFFLGFNFDGYTEYTDLRQSTDSNLRGLATLYVYEDPVIEEFKESIGNEVLVSDFYSRERRISALTRVLLIEPIALSVSLIACKL